LIERDEGIGAGTFYVNQRRLRVQQKEEVEVESSDGCGGEGMTTRSPIGA
jgi:hypothetical protein